jgi:hypothetical protein
MLKIIAIAISSMASTATANAAARATSQDAYYVCMVGNAALILKNQGYVLNEKDTAFYKTIRRKCEKLHPKLTEAEEEGLSEEFEMSITALATIGGGDAEEAKSKAPALVPMAPKENEEEK